MWPEFAAALTGLAALYVLAFWVIRPPRTIAWRDVSVPHRVTRGDDASLEISVTMSSRPTWVSAVGNERRKVEATLEWPVDTRFRGRFAVGPDRLEYADPLGLRTKVLATRSPTEVLVVPRVLPLPRVIASAQTDLGVLGERPGHEQFHSLREYVPGDPMRTVHWRSTARAGKLMVRRMVDTTVPAILVVLDIDRASYNRTSAQFGDFEAASFEQAVDLAASAVWANCTTDHRVALTTTSPNAAVIEITSRNRNSALDWLAMTQSAESALPMRVVELARVHNAGHIALVTGLTSTTSRLTREWRKSAVVSVISTSDWRSVIPSDGMRIP